MSLVPRFFSSTDPGAPVLTGEPGSFTDLLDAVLVLGYGVGASAKSGAGWTREFTATNKRVYRNNPILGTGHFLRVDDSATFGNARHAYVASFKSMDSIDTGVVRSPAVDQLEHGALFVKSATLDSSERPWSIFASSTFFYFLVGPDGGGGSGWWALEEVPYAPMFAGNFVSLKPGDLGNFLVSSLPAANYNGGGSNFGVFYSPAVSLGESLRARGGFVSIGLDGLTESAEVDQRVLGDHASYGVGCGNSRPGPVDPVTLGVSFARVSVQERIGVIRGHLPNVLAPLQRYPFPHGELQTGISGLPAGTTLYPQVWSSWWSQPDLGWSETGMVIFDLSNAWPL